MYLSIILIAKNEERNIARLIESVLACTASIDSKEILLVDSNSTDRTIEIASQYPVRIVRLLPGGGIRFSAAAGRFVGTYHTTGEYVLFLDGDHELFSGWLERALAILENHPDIGVVGGFRVDIPKGSVTNGLVYQPSGMDGAFQDMVHAGPGAIYRRSVLEKAGTFRPYLISDEEPELCMRIRHAGYRVVRTDYPVVYHRTDPEDTISSLFARRKRKLYLGYGQNLRYHARTGLLGTYIHDRGYVLPVAGALILGLVSVLASIKIRTLMPFKLWLGLVALVLSAYSVRNRSVYRTTWSMLNRVLMLEGSIKGLWLPPVDPDAYLANVEIVK